MEQTSEILSPVKDLQLTATIPDEMVSSQRNLIVWCENKLIELRAESSELKEAYEIARDKQWNYRTLQSQHTKSVKKITYYEKLKLALEAGYYIIPNFPVSLFAIRTNKEKPDRKHSYSYWADLDQVAQELPPTVGKYKNPNPFGIRTREEKDKDGKLIQDSESYATDWDDINFPIQMAKPMIMEATSKAMALQIFDQFGIMPAARKEDPVIIGQIKFKTGYTTKLVSFMIAWHLNTNVL